MRLYKLNLFLNIFFILPLVLLILIFNYTFWFVRLDLQYIRQALQASSRMNDMTLSQILNKVHAIMMNEKKIWGVSAATQPAETHDNPTLAINRHGNITFYKCHRPNHFATDCQYKDVRQFCTNVMIFDAFNATKSDTLHLSDKKMGHLTPPKVMKEVLPLITVCVDGIKCTALVDTGCCQSRTNISVCCPWSKQEMIVLMTDGKILRS